jgi:hypothetical protein
LYAFTILRDEAVQEVSAWDRGSSSIKVVHFAAIKQ